VRKAETLRGRDSFQALYRSGRKVDGEVVRCFFRWGTGAGTRVRAGFSVSARRYNAVRRNRAKRLLRAAYDRERGALAGAAEIAGDSLNVLFVYSGGKDTPGTPFRFDRVSMDMNSLCKKVCAAAGRRRI
jgi:ribonuclease P protein component